jgi:hypothetical protein
MYFIKFGNIAVLIEHSRKLLKRGSISNVIYILESDIEFAKMSKKAPFANCRRVDYFNQTKKNVIPGYVLNYALELSDVKAAILSVERDIKINRILE